MPRAAAAPLTGMQATLGTFWPALGVGVALAAAASSARAQDASAPSLRWRAPAECPSEPELRAEIETLLGRAWSPDDGVDAEVSQTGTGAWVLRLQAGDAGERILPGESCEALTQAAALLITWMIDPEAAPESVEAPETTTAGNGAPISATESAGATALAPPTLAPPALAPAAPLPARSQRRDGIALGAPDAPLTRPAGTPVSVGLGAVFVLDVGTLPALRPGLSLEVVVRIDRLDLRARGGWLSTQSALLPNESGAPAGAGVEIEHAGGSLHGCARPLDGAADARPGLAICGGLHVGAMLARGVGVSSPGRGEAVVAALGVGAAMPWAPFDWLDLEVAVEVVVPLGAPSFVVAPFGAAYTLSPVAGRLTLGGHVDVR